MLFADLLSLNPITFLMLFFYSCSCWFRLFLFSLPTQDCYAVLAEKSDQAFFKHSRHTNCNSNSAILRNNISYTWRKNGVTKEAIVLQWAVRTASWDFKSVKKWWALALLCGKCCCFVWKPSWKSHANLN